MNHLIGSNPNLGMYLTKVTRVGLKCYLHSLHQNMIKKKYIYTYIYIAKAIPDWMLPGLPSSTSVHTGPTYEKWLLEQRGINGQKMRICNPRE